MQKNSQDMKVEMEYSDRISYLYMPLVNEKVMSNITPDGHGDNKISQQQFFLEPTSVEDLHSSMATRNFWCKIEQFGLWSVFGYSAKQKWSQEDQASLSIGPFWQEVKRTNDTIGISSVTRSFCPTGKEGVEIMMVTLQNVGDEVLELTPVAAIPIYGRGADRMRDHRHVSSLLNRTKVTKDGVVTTPSMAFDEKGHHKNEMSYGVYGRDEYGNIPVGAIPSVEEFIGEGGCYIQPKSLTAEEINWCKEGYEEDGYETMGALGFPKISLLPGETHSYVVLMSYMDEGMQYLEYAKAEQAFLEMQSYWKEQKVITCKTADQDFNTWMDWVSLQPHLRRIYGCSFLPYHDYGRGGRGWRDLWQDCLALILMNPETVRENLADFFAGVRMDGTNATIIGSKPGEFIADRNAIVRVWMDHAYWPFKTVALYLEQTGDYTFLLEKRPYFKDQIIHRGRAIDPTFSQDETNRMYTEEQELYEGTLFEHILLQQLAQFYDVGEHNHMRLRGADWNDALDMAEQRGESVAFTAAYSGNFKQLAAICKLLREKGMTTIEVFQELEILLRDDIELYENVKEKIAVLEEYCKKCQPKVSGKKITLSLEMLERLLNQMGNWISGHIQKQEWVGDQKQHHWFNGYYDNDGNQVEGVSEEKVKMMLTSQVFTILSMTAEDEQVEQICRAADQYLYDEKVGGYRLNTDFEENKMNLGRMFGFAFGHKENGAVFCHMTVMYAYALYSRGFVKEAYKALKALKEQSMDFETSCIYPSIPEYFNSKGRGMYTYLTGAGSWMVLTVLTQMYGVRGENGNLKLAPQLLKEQFDSEGVAEIQCRFANRILNISYINKGDKEIGDYEVEEIFVNGQKYESTLEHSIIEKSYLETLPEQAVNKITIILN